MDKVIDGKLISDEIKAELKQSIKFEMIKPSIAVIQVGDNQASDTYIKMKEKACDEVGIYFRHYKYDDKTSELTIINKIKELNNDEYVNGIIIQLPLPDGYNEKRLVNTIINSKDIDGLTDINTGRLASGRKTLVPCTAAAVMELLKRSNKYIDDTTPWVLAKDESKTDRLKTVLYNLLECIRISAILLRSYIPGTSDRIFKMLNTKNIEFDTLEFGNLETNSFASSRELIILP